MIRNNVSKMCFAGLVTVAVCLSGCDSGPNNPDTYPVTGTVTYKGSPVEGATVVLTPVTAGLQGASGNTDADGNFELMTFSAGDGALPGEYKVRVFKYEIVAEPAAEEGEEMTPEEEEEAYTGEEDDESASPNLLPAKYENAATSGISHTVTESPTTLNIDLK